MPGGYSSPQKGTEEVVRRAERLQVTLSRREDGWTLDGLPFSLAELGYPNLHDGEAPRRVDSLSLREADHFLRLCEKRISEGQRPLKRAHESFLG
jgi:hypothetical protein